MSLSLSSVFRVLLSLCAELTLIMLLSLFVFDGESYILGGLSLERRVLRWDLVSTSWASGKDLSTF